jgi:hypothetical protein
VTRKIRRVDVPINAEGSEPWRMIALRSMGSLEENLARFVSLFVIIRSRKLFNRKSKQPPGRNPQFIRMNLLPTITLARRDESMGPCVTRPENTQEMMTAWAKREVHCNTMEGTWTGLRNFLRAFRGVHKKYLAQYVAVFEWAHNLKRVTDDFLRLIMGPFIPVPI